MEYISHSIFSHSLRALPHTLLSFYPSIEFLPVSLVSLLCRLRSGLDFFSLGAFGAGYVMASFLGLMVVLLVSVSGVVADSSSSQQLCNGYSELCSRQYSNITYIAAHDSYAVKKDWRKSFPYYGIVSYR
jgi:hypothetical protein